VSMARVMLTGRFGAALLETSKACAHTSTSGKFESSFWLFSVAGSSTLDGRSGSRWVGGESIPLVLEDFKWQLYCGA